MCESFIACQKEVHTGFARIFAIKASRSLCGSVSTSEKGDGGAGAIAADPEARPRMAGVSCTKGDALAVVAVAFAAEWAANSNVIGEDGAEGGALDGEPRDDGLRGNALVGELGLLRDSKAPTSAKALPSDNVLTLDSGLREKKLPPDEDAAAGDQCAGGTCSADSPRTMPRLEGD